jgi:energy-coupling factor transporter ATP-binding protein EcfA2
MHLIEAREISKIYSFGDIDLKALDNVSLTVDKGEFVAIMGQSGSGKSTFMNVIGCLDIPTSGHYLLEGIDVGDTDNDGIPEVCAGAGATHILQWDGATYVEEAILPTYGSMAVVCIGDCDNDGLNEINAGNVDVNFGQSFMEWVFKYSN